MTKTRQRLQSKADTVKKINYDMPVPSAFGQRKHKGENGTLQCSAGPERHGYHVIKDDMVSAWAPAVGHIVDVRWVPRSKEEKKQQAA